MFQCSYCEALFVDGTAEQIHEFNCHLNPRFKNVPPDQAGADFSLLDATDGPPAEEENASLPAPDPTNLVSLEPSIQKVVDVAETTDSESLSPLECFFRAQLEYFSFTKKGINERLDLRCKNVAPNQVGIHCKHCANVEFKLRAAGSERYPNKYSSFQNCLIDMRRERGNGKKSHFSKCKKFPSELKNLFNTLKTSRSRGKISPREYWQESAERKNVIETDEGLYFKDPTDNEGSRKRARLETDPNQEQLETANTAEV